MKLFRKTLYLAGIIAVISTITWAFQPGPDIISECPKCKIKLKQETTMSGNTSGAHYWTDGKMEAPMLPDRPWLIKCPKCKSLLWIDELEKLGEQGSWEKNKKWPDAVEPALPSEDDYFSILKDDRLSDNKKLYAHRSALWLANDAYRSGKVKNSNFSESQKTNLKDFAYLINEEDPDHRLMKAEVFRELGQFDDCIKLLSFSFEDKSQAEIAGFIKSLAEQKVSIVREIITENKSSERAKSLDSIAQSDLRNAATAQEAYYVDNEAYADSIEKLTGKNRHGYSYGLIISDGVTIKIISADKEHYHMISYHEKGENKYEVKGPRGRVTLISE